MDSIIVSVSELRSRLQDIRRSGSENVRLSFLEADDDLPASISFSACKAHDTTVWADFDGVDALPNNEELEKEYLNGINISSHLL